METHAQDVYVTYDNNYTKKRHPFFLQHGNHNYNQMAGFFVGPRGAFHGLSIDTWGEGDVTLVDLSGTIGPDSTYLLRKQLKTACDEGGVFFFLNSFGGFVNDGLALAELINQMDGTAYSADGSCYSSCAVAFLGSNRRVVMGSPVLGFRSPYVVKDGRARCSPDSRLKNLFIRQLGEEDGSFAHRRMQDFCGPEAMWSINVDTMKLLGIISDKSTVKLISQ